MSVNVFSGSGEVVVTWGDNSRSRFHYFWLRENCRCEGCTHPDAWERLLDLSSIPLDIAPSAVETVSDQLELTWPDGHRSVYSFDWLDRHRCEPEARLARKRRRTPWRADDVSREQLSIDYESVLNTDEGLRQWLELLERYGAAIVTGLPCHDDAWASVAQRVGLIEPSHFGVTFHVRSKPNPENLAYTSHGLAPHNDLASRRTMPGIQFLHCLVNDATGGESILVDGLAVSEQLRIDDPDAFAFLSSNPVMFRSVADTWEIENPNPVIRLDRDGDVAGIRLHQALLGPVDVAPDDMGRFYSAYQQLTQLVLRPEFQFRFRLNAGDMQTFDNERVAHSRMPFDPNSGDRHLQGGYLTADDTWSRLAVLRRERVDEFRDC